MNSSEADDEDISSEGEDYDEIDSDDVDSDDLYEPMDIVPDVESGGLSQQQDFVGFP